MNVEFLIKQIDQVTLDFEQVFGHLSKEELNWRPNEKCWSIAQNIDHLIVINRTYFPIFKKIKDGTYSVPWFSKFGFVTNFFGKIILQSVQPARIRKMKTFKMWEPGSKTNGDILDQFKGCQEQLKFFVADLSMAPFKDSVMSSPANKNIVYTLEMAFNIVITHETRHLQQAKEVLLLRGK